MRVYILSCVGLHISTLCKPRNLFYVVNVFWHITVEHVMCRVNTPHLTKCGKCYLVLINPHPTLIMNIYLCSFINVGCRSRDPLYEEKLFTNLPDYNIL